ncbi:MAG: polyprenyl diphosphate synthase [Sphaerochaetaceae bacterium]|nr:polyprenyl diphosphate synthase [Sphaerochaetaceae bacterium]MDC7236413.1 polyprenyl diphosphate synthase [Sphaerochaetaceae bacterium]MDC7250233.1 polyprenyl diphosphate synthase [Sphaerochaetaceae bacterium]
MSTENLTHLAVIMDGNGRWAKKRNLPRTAGHLAGLKALKKIILASKKSDVKFLSLYAFSTENWRRPDSEVNYLMNLIASKLPSEIKFYKSEQIRILVRGDRTNLPKAAINAINKVEDETKEFSAITVILCINYGGHDEIVRSVNSILKENPTTEITEDLIKSHMQFNDIVPCVDMIVRSAGEKRLSNFLLWESAYAELGFYDTLFPDWDEQMINIVIKDYQSRIRKFGGIS